MTAVADMVVVRPVLPPPEAPSPSLPPSPPWFTIGEELVLEAADAVEVEVEEEGEAARGERSRARGWGWGWSWEEGGGVRMGVCGWERGEGRGGGKKGGWRESLLRRWSLRVGRRERRG